MENELVKNLCSKQNFEQAAYEIINKPDVEAFSKLVEKSDFLFDFVKQNVIKRLQNCINKNNYKNLISFLNFYSYDYEDLIVSNIIKFKDDEITKTLYNKLKTGTLQEKAYCVKILDSKEIKDYLYINIDSDFEPLVYNCAQALGKLHDKKSFNDAIKNLNSNDEFLVLSSVKFLCAYGDKSAIPHIFNSMKKSSMSENIACEIIYLDDIFNLLKSYPQDTLLLINNLINGLGEVIPISVIFDIQLYELIEHLDSPLTLLNLKQKINQLTENDEYLFDEDKSVKDEMFSINDLLNSKNYWDNLFEELEVKEDDFIFFNLQIINDYKLDYSNEIMNLIYKTQNQTIITKAIEVMKNIGQLSKLSKEKVLSKITSENSYAIIQSYFNE